MSKPRSGERLPDAVDRLQREIADLHRSRRRLVEAGDADRRAIERAVHDGVQQDLVALAIDLRRLAGLIRPDPAAAHALCAEMESNVRDAIDSATELAEMAYPPLLEARGLTGALRSAAERAGVATVLDVQAGIGCPPEILSTIYWFCVEALSSASAGAQATISVVETDGALTFGVTGAGNHPEAAVDRLRDRIEALGGRLGLDDAHDGGWRLHGWLPLSR